MAQVNPNPNANPLNANPNQGSPVHPATPPAATPSSSTRAAATPNTPASVSSTVKSISSATPHTPAQAPTPTTAKDVAKETVKSVTEAANSVTLAGAPIEPTTQRVGHVVPTTFPSDFPVYKDKPQKGNGRGYALFANKAADQLTIFVLCLAVCATFMALLLTLTKWCERGRKKEDHMITDATRWGEHKGGDRYRDDPLPQYRNQAHPGLRGPTPVQGRYVEPSARLANANAHRRGSMATIGTDFSGMTQVLDSPRSNRTAGTKGTGGTGRNMYGTPNTSGGFYSDAADAGSVHSFATVSTITPQSHQGHQQPYHHQAQQAYHQSHQQVHNSPPRRKPPPSQLLAPPPRHTSRPQQQWTGPQYPLLPSQQPRGVVLAQPPPEPQWRKPIPYRGPGPQPVMASPPAPAQYPPQPPQATYPPLTTPPGSASAMLPNHNLDAGTSAPTGPANWRLSGGPYPMPSRPSVAWAQI